jgi:hypothetical protein
MIHKCFFSHTKMEGLKKSNKPIYVGPGTWFTMTSLSKRATTPLGKIVFTETVKAISEEFRCAECKKHMISYIDKHPISNSFTSSNQNDEANGCFKWMFEFHNTVNRSLGKPIVLWEDVYAYWYNPIICQEDCNDEHSDEIAKGKEGEKRGEEHVLHICERE